jgi:hypothetical protein
MRLESPIRSDTSRPGDAFTAVLVSPLRAGDGGVVAAAGARITGHVVAVDVEGGSLRVAFDEVDTLVGPAKLVATIDRAEQIASLGTAAGSSAIGDTRLYRRFAYPGTAPAYLAYPSSRVVVVPRGAALDGRLTRPLIPPGSRIDHGVE